MAIEYKPVPGVIRVPLAKPWTNFYCLIVPDPEQGENYRDFYLLCDGFGVVEFMFGCYPENDDDAAELAYYNGPDYIEPEKYQ